MTGPRTSTDPADAFIAIFDALNWAVAIHDRLDHELGDDWDVNDPDGDVVEGFRYARNIVHHEWLDALYMTDGFVLPSPLPVGFFEWRWIPTLEGSKHRGRQEYHDRLADQPVRFTLATLADVHGRAASRPRRACARTRP
jgi:hypothetical protein